LPVSLVGICSRFLDQAREDVDVGDEQQRHDHHRNPECGAQGAVRCERDPTRDRVDEIQEADHIEYRHARESHRAAFADRYERQECAFRRQQLSQIGTGGSVTSLAQALDEYGYQAYLLTVSPDGPHASHVQVTLAGGELQFAVGNTARRNTASNANVSLLWPPRETGGYSIVVNGMLKIDEDDGRARVAINKSVFHRPGPPADPGGACSSDCQQLSYG
jgi:hypothetical protein